MKLNANIAIKIPTVPVADRAKRTYRLFKKSSIRKTGTTRQNVYSAYADSVEQTQRELANNSFTWANWASQWMYGLFVDNDIVQYLEIYALQSPKLPKAIKKVSVEHRALGYGGKRDNTTLSVFEIECEYCKANLPYIASPTHHLRVWTKSSSSALKKAIKRYCELAGKRTSSSKVNLDQSSCIYHDKPHLMQTRAYETALSYMMDAIA